MADEATATRPDSHVPLARRRRRRRRSPTDEASVTLPDADDGEAPPVRRRRHSRPIEDLTLTEAQLREGKQEVQRLHDKKKGIRLSEV